MRSISFTFFSISNYFGELVSDSMEIIFLFKFYLLLKLCMPDIYLSGSLMELVRLLVLILSSKFDEYEEDNLNFK